MSATTDLADLIRARLLTPPATGEIPTLLDLTHLDVIIYRQQTLTATVEAAIGKASGCAILIEWNGFKVTDENTSRPRLAESYQISVYSKPIIDAGNYPAELVIKSILLRLWHWRPQVDHVFGEAKPANGGVMPSKQYLIYDCTVTIPISL